MRQQQKHICQKLWLILSFCGGTYSKFRERLKGDAWEEDYINLNNKIVCINGIVEFWMFTLVSKPLELVIGGLSWSPWSTFEFWSWLTKSLLYIVHCVQPKKIKNQKNQYMLTFLFLSGRLAWSLILGLAGPSSPTGCTKLVGWFDFVCYICFHCTISCVFKNLCQRFGSFSTAKTTTLHPNSS